MGVREDIHNLRSLVRYTDTTIVWMVNSERIPDRELLRLFSEGLTEVRERLSRVEYALADISSDEDSRYRKLQEVGLTGAQLQIKMSVLDWIVVTASRKIQRALEWINSFLGSLTRVFDQLDLVKEFKEHLEMVVRFQHGRGSVPSPPKPVLGL